MNCCVLTRNFIDVLANYAHTDFLDLTFEEKIGQLFFVGIRGAEIDSDTAALLGDVKPGGICLFSRNIKEVAQTRTLLDAIRKVSNVEPFLSIDQEGGLVDRFRRIMPSAPAASKFTNVEDVAEFAELTADTLRILGFNMNFAPVVDVIHTEREVVGNGLYSRAFGKNQADVVELAGTFLNEMQARSIIGCLKHFPGLGASAVDSHEELPQVNIDDPRLNEIDLFPYRELLNEGVEMVMIAHAAYPNLAWQETDSNGKLLPSSLNSNFITGLLREELRFTGIAITDDLEMGAIVKNYGIGEACKMAILAGNDMLAICASEDRIREGFETVLTAVSNGEIPESRIDDSLQRIASLKSKLSAPADFDIERLNEISERMLKLSARLN